MHPYLIFTKFATTILVWWLGESQIDEPKIYTHTHTVIGKERKRKRDGVQKYRTFYLTWASMIWFSIKCSNNNKWVYWYTLYIACQSEREREREQAKKNPNGKKKKKKKYRNWFHHIGPCDTTCGNLKLIINIIYFASNIVYIHSSKSNIIFIINSISNID